MNAEERWKRLREWIEQDLRFSEMVNNGFWVGCFLTDRVILDEMARLEKED